MTPAARHQRDISPASETRRDSCRNPCKNHFVPAVFLGGTLMKRLSFALVLTGSVLMSNAALAQQMTADDLKWINQCIGDNKDQGAKSDVVRKYCICMNEKMDNNETQSITQWEKTHAKERKECDRVAGWK
jgi:hypothetical protein